MVEIERQRVNVLSKSEVKFKSKFSTKTKAPSIGVCFSGTNFQVIFK